LKANITFGGQKPSDASSPEVNRHIEEDLDRDEDNEYNIDAEMDEAEIRAIESIREEEYTRAKI